MYENFLQIAVDSFAVALDSYLGINSLGVK